MPTVDSHVWSVLFCTEKRRSAFEQRCETSYAIVGASDRTGRFVVVSIGYRTPTFHHHHRHGPSFYGFTPSLAKTRRRPYWDIGPLWAGIYGPFRLDMYTTTAPSFSARGVNVHVQCKFPHNKCSCTTSTVLILYLLYILLR